MLQWMLGGVVAAALLLAAADLLLWKMKEAKGNGYDSIQVSRMTVATLKGTKEEYYFDGTEMRPCTRSLLPMPASDGWETPCWYLRGHHSVVVRY